MSWVAWELKYPRNVTLNVRQFPRSWRNHGTRVSIVSRPWELPGKTGGWFMRLRERGVHGADKQRLIVNPNRHNREFTGRSKMLPMVFGSTARRH